MAKRFDETDNFINTVLTEANWTQANIKVKLNEETNGSVPAGLPTQENEDEEEEEEDEEEDEDIQDSVQLGYDACPLCESSLKNDDVIFENIDTHFNNLLAIVDQAQSLEEGEEFDGNLIVEAVAPDGCCPLCESVVEDDEVLLANMNEHFDVVLEMLDELQEAKEMPKQATKSKPIPKPKKA